MPGKRIAIGAFMLESNGHAPVATRDQFESYGIFEGQALLDALAKPAPRAPGGLSGFQAAMNAGAPWEALPLLSVQGGASGNMDQDFFEACVTRMAAGLRAAMPVDGVFLALHGAATATAEPDPDGVLLDLVRGIVGADVPVIATFDLHANISERMARAADMLIGYRTNPHVDMVERGIGAGRTITLGPTALLRLDGIRVAVITERRQLSDPAMLEHLGVDLSRVRSLVVKSRGHFRAGFDEFFPRDRIIEVDVPGLTTVVLSRVPWRHVPRPIWPLDPQMVWRPNA